MMQTRTHWAEDVSAVLAKALPISDASVEHYRENAVWDQAIISSLAVFANMGTPLPADTREIVQELLDAPGVNPKLRKGALYHLTRIPE